MTELKKQKYFDCVDNAIKYMNENTKKLIRFEDILKNVTIGETYFKKFFKIRTGCSVMHYFKTLKVEEAKKLIDSKNMTFTEIAAYLGYDSIHDFSRQFKTITGICPTEYKNRKVKKIK